MLLDEHRSGKGSRLEDHPLLSANERARVLKCVPFDAETARRLSVQIIEESSYPELLAQVKEQPPCLFASGDWSALEAPAVAIVGTRSASNYGRAVAQKFAESFAAAGLTVVSGGALGIDAAAHRGALGREGKTVAVLAGGLDKLYPKVHSSLFRQIAKSGCLVTPFSLGVMPDRYRFIVRNRLAAALCRAVVVVEAPERSGALSTAGAAAELGRDVYVVPANIDNPNFRGSHALIRDGATLVDHPDQVLAELGIAPTVAKIAEKSELSGLGARICAMLTTEPTTMEKLTETIGGSSAEIAAELTMLELDGRVVRIGGGYCGRL